METALSQAVLCCERSCRSVWLEADLYQIRIKCGIGLACEVGVGRAVWRLYCGHTALPSQCTHTPLSSAHRPLQRYHTAIPYPARGDRGTGVRDHHTAIAAPLSQPIL